MSRGTNQKLKLLYLAKIMNEKTDDAHWLTVPEVIKELSAYDVTAERKSVYADFEALRQFGMDIVMEKEGVQYYYHIGTRDMEVAELKLLVDAVQSSKFITEKKSNQLIKKLEKSISKYEAKQLNRQVYVHGRVKTMNESIYYNVDKIHNAINNNVQIKFQYYQWNVNKEMELRHGGTFYHISPWELMWDDENYYLVGYDSEAGIIKHFRVDKMIKISPLTDLRDGKEIFDQIDMVSYSNKRFGMYDGEEKTVQLEFENYLAGVVLDRFGKDVKMRAMDDRHFKVAVEVAISPQFFGWVMGLGSGVKIVGPAEVVEQMKQEVGAIHKLYD
ncbi:MAG: WYL domain-containing protein [Eubacteriales bacterium]|nr:WYL domain-containing protein [Eubacteriales bacterium]